MSFTEKERTREEWRSEAYRLQARINQHKAGPLLGKLPPQPPPEDSGRGTAVDWCEMCVLLARYATAYTRHKPPSERLLKQLERQRAAMWD